MELIGAEGMPFGWMDERKGVLAVTGGYPVEPERIDPDHVAGHIDAEQTPLYSFRIRPWERRDHWSDWEDDEGSLRVDVLIDDENEHAPRVAEELLKGKRIVVEENTPIGSRVVHLGWTDADQTSGSGERVGW